MLSSKLILTDVDGVLLDWWFAFSQWMKQKGHPVVAERQYGSHGQDICRTYGLELDYVKFLIKVFNESAHVGWIPPYRDAIKYVKKLHEDHGVIFHAITSFSEDMFSYELRKQNLTNLFGPTAFQKLTIMGIETCKSASLEDYRDTGVYFIEDRITNIELGEKMGLRPVLMLQEYNEHYAGSAPRVKNWKELYDLIEAEGEIC